MSSAPRQPITLRRHSIMTLCRDAACMLCGRGLLVAAALLARPRPKRDSRLHCPRRPTGTSPAEAFRAQNRLSTLCGQALAAAFLAAQAVPLSIADDVAGDGGGARASLPAVVHCGRIDALRRRDRPVSWVELDSLIVDGHLTAGTGDVATAAEQRAPAAGMSFVLVEATVLAERSLSKYDYQLRAAGKGYSCLGMSVGDGPVDPRRWKVSGPAETRLFFEIPASVRTVDLVPALSLSVPMRTVEGIDLPASLSDEGPLTGPPAAAETPSDEGAAGGSGREPAAADRDSGPAAANEDTAPAAADESRDRARPAEKTKPEADVLDF